MNDVEVEFSEVHIHHPEILPYRAGAVQHLATPMDRMLPQDVVGLDRIRCGECQSVAQSDGEAYTTASPSEERSRSRSSF